MLSLFSGIGGIDIAAQWAGIETVAFCEIEPYAVSVLKKRFPGVPVYGDVRKISKETLEEDGISKVDIVCGGFPCQPFSVAGSRKGQEDDRYLWPEMLRIVGELKPRWVLGENVAGLLSITDVSGRRGGNFWNHSLRLGRAWVSCRMVVLWRWRYRGAAPKRQGVSHGQLRQLLIFLLQV